MREYKFRGKRIDNGEWVYGFYWNNGVFENHLIRVNSINDKFAIKDYEVIPETVGQSIGLLDKNGKEIYTGDIIKNYTYNRVYSLNTFGDLLNFYYWYNERVCEIIGNIHENKELLDA